MFFTPKKDDAILNEANVSKTRSEGYRFLVFIVAVIMPVAGLEVNRTFFGGPFGGGFFGDFSNIWFYIIAILNGLIMLVDINATKPGIMLFYLKIVGFTFITYFAIIFIPNFPLGILGLILYGLGMLVFVPATVFFVELSQISRDILKLREKSNAGVIAAIILGILTIPTVLTVDFSLDKINFNKALTYLSADSWEMPTVNIARLNRSLKHINSVLETRQGDLVSNRKNSNSY